MDLCAHHKKKQFASWRTLLPQLRLLFAILIGGASLLWGFFLIPYFRISAIKTNDPLLDDAMLRSSLASTLTAHNKLFLPKKNIFLFSPSDAEQVLREQGVGISKIKKRYPNTILIEFESTEPKFIFCPDVFCYYINQNGILSERAPIFSDNPLPLLVTPHKNPVLGDQIISKRAGNFLTIFQKSIALLHIAAVKIEMEQSGENTTDSINITVRGESDRAHTWQLFVSEQSDPEKLAGDLGLLIREKIKDTMGKLEYIDLRFPDKAFFKLD